MKLAIVVAPGVGRVKGLVGAVKDLQVDLADRQANDVAFPGEYIVRMPRSVSTPTWARRRRSWENANDNWWHWFRESVQFARRTWGCLS